MDNLLQWIIALATTALAIVTALMWRATSRVAQQTTDLAAETHRLGQETRALALQTVESNALADRHQQEQLMPCLEYIGAISTPGLKALYAWGSIKNIGHGLALNVRLSFGVGQPVNLRPIAAGKRLNWTQAPT